MNQLESLLCSILVKIHEYCKNIYGDPLIESFEPIDKPQIFILSEIAEDNTIKKQFKEIFVVDTYVDYYVCGPTSLMYAHARRSCEGEFGAVAPLLFRPSCRLDESLISLMNLAFLFMPNSCLLYSFCSSYYSNRYSAANMLHRAEMKWYWA